jgi:hypothetical protein
MTGPGVYVLYGEADECLYVGSSLNMEQRIKCTRYRKLAKRVDFIPHEAKTRRVKEQEMIDLLRPKLNRMPAVSKAPGNPKIARRFMVYLTHEDARIIDSLGAWMGDRYGQVTTTAILRLAIRLAYKQKARAKSNG